MERALIVWLGFEPRVAGEEGWKAMTNPLSCWPPKAIIFLIFKNEM